ncbi:hypothetical protein DFH08DRAFT_957560 [Mycena albidolilacea]|uniref:Uncharacterized protein n=1 Tax=Mycena albidolilacea TaxID=1033008 RepID=A0AAD7ETL8_9AGAR|nr:hypothetical protein DFH08DRAFT_957560 [Mycena albidolilacea]
MSLTPAQRRPAESTANPIPSNPILHQRPPSLPAPLQPNRAPPQQQFAQSSETFNHPQSLQLQRPREAPSYESFAQAPLQPQRLPNEVLLSVIYVDPGNNKEGWKIEKMYSDVLALDQRMHNNSRCGSLDSRVFDDPSAPAQHVSTSPARSVYKITAAVQSIAPRLGEVVCIHPPVQTFSALRICPSLPPPPRGINKLWQAAAALDLRDNLFPIPHPPNVFWVVLEKVIEGCRGSRSVGIVCTSIDISTVTTPDKGRRVFGSVGVGCTSATYPPVLHQTKIFKTPFSRLWGRIDPQVSNCVGVVCTGVDIPPSTPPDKTLGRPRASCAVVQAVASLNASASSAPVSTYPSILLQIKECSARMHSSCLCGRLGRLVTARVGVVCTGVDILTPQYSSGQKTPFSCLYGRRGLRLPERVGVVCDSVDLYTVTARDKRRRTTACAAGQALVFPNALASSALLFAVSTYTLLPSR